MIDSIQGARVIDAGGKFLIPGLWDMHVHWYNRDTLTLFTANGVTGIREMFGNSDLLRWRDEVAKGSLQGPRMVVASPIIDGPQPVWPNSISVRDEDEGRNKEVEVVGDMSRAGVLFLAGTDTGNPFCFPGFSLHDELVLLVKAGLTPTESLRAATLNPAKFFGLDQTLGTIERGKLADLVLLEANPLEDIRNTQRIDAVVMNGRFYDRSADTS
jgi:imidazolonepropionase-like amidohydrolase